MCGWFAPGTNDVVRGQIHVEHGIHVHRVTLNSGPRSEEMDSSDARGTPTDRKRGDHTKQIIQLCVHMKYDELEPFLPRNGFKRSVINLIFILPHQQLFSL